MIVQIGPYPPPIGGRSIYVKRLKDILDKNNINNEVWTNSNISSINGVKKYRNREILFRFLKNKKDIDIIHMNQAGRINYIYFGMLNLFFGKKITKIITMHSDCRGIFKGFWGKVLKFALNTNDYIICVKKGDKELLEANGVNVKIIEENAYLNPIINIESLPIDIETFIENKDFIISGNASSLDSLYSIEELINMMYLLKKNYKSIGLVFLIPQITDKKELDRLEKIIKDKNLKGEILLYYKSKIDFSSLILKSNLTIRPTKRDGYGISIAESISLNVPVLASDACERAEGTILFQNYNYDDMLEKTKNIIDNYNYYLKKVKEVSIKDASETILNLYQHKIIKR